jgi:hypothetical protein
MFWKMQCTTKKENDAPMLYEVIFPHLAGGNLTKAILKVTTTFVILLSHVANYISSLAAYLL